MKNYFQLIKKIVMTIKIEELSNQESKIIVVIIFISVNTRSENCGFFVWFWWHESIAISFYGAIFLSSSFVQYLALPIRDQNILLAPLYN